MTAQTIAQLFDLSGKGVIVTGGGAGMGEAISLRLAEAGAGVLVADVDLPAASRVAADIRGRGGTAQAVECDVSRLGDAEKTVAACIEAFGCLDILVNNAGVYPAATVLGMSEEVWDKVFDINLKGLFFYSQAVAREMSRVGRGGKIINIASLDALRPSPLLSHYSASKGGVVMLTKALALELAPHKILVNAIAPGVIWTPGLAVHLRSFYEPMGLTLEEFMPTFLSRIPLARMAEPDDIAKVALFLASGASDYMTGEVVVVDGGLLVS